MSNTQTPYQDDQDFEIDIDKLYNDFIKKIDSIRSIVNISIKDNELKFKDLTEANVLKLSNTLKVESTPQESRCHAFYRLVGFPVVSKSFDFYNPGFDNIKSMDRTILLADKIAIANKPIEGFNELSTKRELYISNIQKVFFLNKTIDASVLALSGTNIRLFSSAFEKSSEPFDMQPKNQSYICPFDGRVVDKLSLFEYEDYDGTTSTKNSKEKYHYIKPFIVDARIDFSVNPSKNKIAVPFVNTRSELKLNEIDYVNRPLIEKVIRDRILVATDSTLGTKDQTLNDYIKSIEAIKDEDLINKISGDTYNTSEKSQFIRFIKIIQLMCKKLVEAEKIIEEVQSKYYWLPVPATNGPEFGSSVAPVVLVSNKKLITKNDFDIIKKQLSASFSLRNKEISDVNGVPDPNNFGFDSFKTSFDASSGQGINSVSVNELDNLLNIRTSIMTKANSALRDIEIIMGEFSGFGLCDIIAIMGALYVMPKDDLVGFLDENAYTRFKRLKSDVGRTKEIDSTLKSFNSYVKDFYILMNKIYKDYREYNGL